VEKYVKRTVDFRHIAGIAVAALGVIPAAAPAQTAPAQVPAQAAPVPSPLAQIPGVVVRYYDVSGITTEAIRASIDAQRPRNAATGMGIPSSASWSIRTSLNKATTGKACKITGATAALKGEVVLPRLVNAETVPAPVLAQWRTYVASLEQQQAAVLLRPYQRLFEVERAVMASSCEGAAAAASRAIAEITKAPPPPPPPPVTPVTPVTPAVPAAPVQ
jgi:predicted secreted Zn-dependent protease